MHSNLGKIEDRNIVYIQISEPNWAHLLPAEKWVLFAVGNKESLSDLDTVVKICLDKNVLYVCSAGEAAQEIENAFDSESVTREISSNISSEDVLMTTTHSNFDEGFWFAATLAANSVEANTIVCINLTKSDLKERLTTLIQKINDGWLPPDE